MFCAGRNQVNPCGFDAGVAEHVGQARHIVADAVERDRKQVPQVMREHLARRDACFFAECLHLRPNLLPRKSRPVSGEKDLAGDGFFFFFLLEQLFAQLARQQNRADLALERDVRPALPRGLDRDIL